MNILIIDDHDILKEGIFKLVKSIFPEAKCLFSNTIRNAIAKINQNRIDLLISDLEFGNSNEMDGFYLVKNLKKIEPRIKTIAHTNYNSYRIMKKAMAAGFNSFLDKSCSEDDFQNTLIQVMKLGVTKTYQSESMSILLKKKDLLYRNIFSDSLYGLSDLSERELELTLLSTQTTDRKELAVLMQIKESTIDTHFKNTLKKLDLKHRKELALFSEEFKNEISKYKK